MGTDYRERVPAPHKDSVNTGLSPARQATMLTLLGAPRQRATDQCQEPTNQKLLSLIVLENVGPFRVRGLRPAVASLKRIFERVKRDKPDLYAQLGSAGMLCCRFVRGSKTAWSNHSWGTAIDIKIGGELDVVGDGKSQRGLLELYRYFRDEGWYWGVEFSREDSMHFEVADETMRRWAREGLL